MRMKNINIRPVKIADIASLEAWRHAYWEGDLEIPFGYGGDGVETAVAEQNGELLEGLVAKKCVILDPLMVNQNADHKSIVAGLFLLERALTYSAQLGGAIESYIAIPEQLEPYFAIVEKAGYERTAKNCVVFRRALKQETIPMLGPERDELVRKMNEAQLAPSLAEEKAKDVELELESPDSCAFTQEQSTTSNQAR